MNLPSVPSQEQATDTGGPAGWASLTMGGTLTMVPRSTTQWASPSHCHHRRQASLQQWLTSKFAPAVIDSHSSLSSVSISSPQSASFTSSCSAPPPPPSSFPPLPPEISPTSQVGGEFFYIIIINTVIVAIAAVVFTSLPPTEARTSNIQQVHYSSYSIIYLTVNHAVSHT